MYYLDRVNSHGWEARPGVPHWYCGAAPAKSAELSLRETERVKQERQKAWRELALKLTFPAMYKGKLIKYKTKS